MFQIQNLRVEPQLKDWSRPSFDCGLITANNEVVIQKKKKKTLKSIENLFRRHEFNHWIFFFQSKSNGFEKNFYQTVRDNALDPAGSERMVHTNYLNDN